MGGAVRFAQVNPTTFVVSFEHVPPWRQTPDPNGPTYTFQLVLHANGKIEFVYGAMGALPDRWSVGASFDATRGQSLACYRTDPIAGGTQWGLHNQPQPSLWLGANPIDLTIEPGHSASIAAVVSGFGYAAWHPNPFAGTLRLFTNDPGQASVDLPASASVGPPPYQLVLPVISR